MIVTDGGVIYPGMLRGTVAENDDPLGKHRVRIIIPGIVDDGTDWAYPATAGGGGPQRGGHVVPAVGADVWCWFEHGDPNGVVGYMAGWWGETSAGSETPTDVRAAGEQAHEVQSLEVDGLSITIDERLGQRSFRVVAREPDGQEIASLEIDRESRGIVLSATTAIVIRAVGAVQIDAPLVQINERSVLATARPI